jgi:hypothetical protein
MEPFEILRVLVGLAVFFAAGWFSCNAVFKKNDLDLIEKTVASVTFALIIPAVLILFASLALSIRLNEFIIYGAYVLTIAASFAYRNFDLNAFSLN